MCIVYLNLHLTFYCLIHLFQTLHYKVRSQCQNEMFILVAKMFIFTVELWYPTANIIMHVAFVTMIFPQTTYRFASRELYRVICGGLWESVAYSGTLAKHRSL